MRNVPGSCQGRGEGSVIKLDMGSLSSEETFPMIQGLTLWQIPGIVVISCRMILKRMTKAVVHVQ